MAVYETPHLAQAIAGFGTLVCSTLALVQAWRSKFRMGDILTTYLTDVLTILIVLDIAFIRQPMILGLFAAMVKGGVTLIRAHKEKAASPSLR